MSVVINLNEVNDKNRSSTMIGKEIPNNSLKIDSQSETIIKSTSKGSAVISVGYNKAKPNLNAPAIITFTRGVGTENDNIEIDPSLLLNPQSSLSALVPSHAVASCVDVRLRSYGENYIASNRSAVISNADVIQHRGNEIIELVVGNSAYRTAGPRIASSGGVYLVKAGKEEKIQPMVLGNNLVRTMLELVDIINNLSTRIVEIRKDIVLLKTFLMAHVHITAVGPTTPSPDLAATLGTSMVTDSFEISNNISNTVNLELFKFNNLLPFSENKITSEDHKLT